MAKLSFNEKEIKKMSKKKFLKEFAKYERFVEGGLEAYYNKLKGVKLSK